MFTYIDPSVRKRLVEQGKLFRIDQSGERVAPDHESSSATISILGPIPMPMRLCELDAHSRWYACVRNTDLARINELADDLRAQNAQQSFATLASSMAVNSVLIIGDPERWSEPLVRVHSSCLTGDVFGSQRCECGPQLQAAVDRIQKDEQGGLIVYMSGHEGRGIGLWAKAATYVLQDGGEDTYEANRSLGLPDDCRDFTDAGSLLKYFARGLPIRLMTNNPKKVDDLTAMGVAGITAVKHVTGVTDSNRRYLQAKKGWGHKLEEDDLEG